MLKPLLKMDSKEDWFPVGVEESLALHGYHWSTYTWAQKIAPRITTHGERLDFPQGMRQPDLPAVGYHEMIREGFLFWHRFWFWYLYNPKGYGPLDSGRHEGDWEYIALGCVDAAGDQPVLATYSQHQTGAKLAAWDLEYSTDARPVAYVARGSHAHYAHPVDTWEDEADGDGPILRDVEWREAHLQPWWTWKGKWGNSTGEGQSPSSPGRQRRHPTLEWSRGR